MSNQIIKLQKKLQKFTLQKIRNVCKKMKVKYNKKDSKKIIINKLLSPFLKYRMNNIDKENILRDINNLPKDLQILIKKYCKIKDMSGTDLLLNRIAELPEDIQGLIADDHKGLANTSATTIQRNVRMRNEKRNYIKQLIEDMMEQKDNFSLDTDHDNFVEGLMEDYMFNQILNYNPLYSIDMDEVNELQHMIDPPQDEPANIHEEINETVDVVKADILRKKIYFILLNLSGVNLSGLNLIWADFSKKNLKNTNFKNSILSNVNFKGANLTGVNLIGANLTGAIYDQDTKFSVGFNPTDYGMILN